MQRKSKTKLQLISLFDVLLTMVKNAPLSPLSIYGFCMFKSIKKDFQLLNNLVSQTLNPLLFTFDHSTTMGSNSH